ncbi:MFS transporter [uncultured Phenylobacterium sp.]|uniref:MFS transporter n=1 Tax=uncultured Phenylobacterium sp. TaxID=349273 RepID=UPI0025F73319|nr:MFS transporter [uncultured Phenylobacterium sp.]
MVSALNRPPMSRSTTFAFAGANLPVMAIALAISVYLPKYFASNIGVSLAAVGGAFALVRLIDIPLDPLLGMAMDRTRTRIGRYRLWMLIGTPILLVSIHRLFLPPPGITEVYLIGWLLMMYVGFSIIVLAHSAWASTLSKTYDERTRLFAAMTAVGVGGQACVLLAPLLLKELGYSETAGVQGMGWFIIAATPVAVALMLWRTPEYVAPASAAHPHFRLKDYVALVTQPDMARILAADLCLSLGPGCMSALYLFFFTASRGFTLGQASLLLLVNILVGFVGAPAMGKLATRIGKHRATMVACAGFGAMMATLMAIPQGDMVVAIPIMLAFGFFSSGFVVLTRAMVADVSDLMRLEQGQERAGLLFALTTLTSKVAGALSIFLTYQLLARIGFDARAGAANTREAIHAMELVYLITPTSFVLLGGACFIGYRLTAARHAVIRRDLDLRDAAIQGEAEHMAALTGEPLALRRPSEV